MLSCPGLGDDFGLAHSLGQQSLSQHIIDFMSPGVVQLVTFQIQLRPAKMLCQPGGKI